MKAADHLNMPECLYRRYPVHMSEEEHYEAFSSGNTYVGVGITLDTSYPYGIVVRGVMPGSPAEEQGIQPWDIITSVDGEDVKLFKYEDIINLVRGEAGTTVKMGILRQNVGQLELELERRMINSPNVAYVYAGNGIGVIRIGRFGCIIDYLDFAEIYHAFAADEEVNSLIIDLRGNTGGDAGVLHGMMDIMVPDKDVTLFKLMDSQETEEFKSTGHGGIWTPDNTIILIDERTISAAEVFAGSLRQLELAELVGTTTYGKARSQFHIILSDGSVAIISSHEVLLPDGTMYEGEGITPDFTVYIEGKPYPLETLEELNANTPLYKGRVSNSILAMQQRLYALGIHPIEPNGYFGDITLWSLNVFQKTMELSVTSHATTETLRVLEQEVKNTKIYEDDQMTFALNRLKGVATD
jgi:carboxyl-terminal processing protease